MVVAYVGRFITWYYPEEKKLQVCVDDANILEYKDIPVDIFAALITDKDPPRYWYEFIANRYIAAVD